jgi:VWFA-related protein
VTGLASVLLVAAGLHAPQASQAPTFAASVEAVYLDVFVTQDGRPVTGLSDGDFELRVDGRRRAVELVAVESLPLRAFVVLDTSGSVRGLKLAELQAGVLDLLRGLRPGDEAALVSFDHEIAVRVPPTGDLARLERGVREIRPQGSTALYDAIYAATLLATGRGRPLLVAFSDGEDNLSWLGAPQLLRALEESNVLVQVVASVPQEPPVPASVLGRAQPRAEPIYVRTLRRLAEVTGGQFWPAATPERLAKAFPAILEAMRTRYVLRFEPEAPRRPGLHTVDVRLVRRGGKVHSRRAYFVGPASR